MMSASTAPDKVTTTHGSTGTASQPATMVPSGKKLYEMKRQELSARPSISAGVSVCHSA